LESGYARRAGSQRGETGAACPSSRENVRYPAVRRSSSGRTPTPKLAMGGVYQLIAPRAKARVIRSRRLRQPDRLSTSSKRSPGKSKCDARRRGNSAQRSERFANQRKAKGLHDTRRRATGRREQANDDAAGAWKLMHLGSKNRIQVSMDMRRSTPSAPDAELALPPSKS